MAGDLAHAGNADLAYAGAAASRYGHLTHAGNADLAYDGAAQPGAPPPGTGVPPELSGPVASFSYTPAEPSTQDMVTFDGSGSRPGDAPVTGYEWLFGGQATRSGPVVTWRLPSGPGSYDATLTVTDANDLTGTMTQVITI